MNDELRKVFTPELRKIVQDTAAENIADRLLKKMADPDDKTGEMFRMAVAGDFHRRTDETLAKAALVSKQLEALTELMQTISNRIDVRNAMTLRRLK